MTRSRERMPSTRNTEEWALECPSLSGDHQKFFSFADGSMTEASGVS
jgi:hypothetical protein